MCLAINKYPWAGLFCGFCPQLFFNSPLKIYAMSFFSNTTCFSSGGHITTSIIYYLLNLSIHANGGIHLEICFSKRCFVFFVRPKPGNMPFVIQSQIAGCQSMIHTSLRDSTMFMRDARNAGSMPPKNPIRSANAIALRMIPGLSLKRKASSENV
ncbi:hypothetical protein KSMBR1_2735 [Candidatus Kuenenia stuttgartiensis]|uniref:Uncharacterized protein n=1 Tax=Kuenenia stuttgartiensis TaxID=174633 RepID=A0A2C9CHN4_KUEST|nr:hypothetical protein KSMBR1_2735 [Candidatus Kuenenia stuttgartiensis]